MRVIPPAAAPRGARTTPPTVERLTPVSRPSSSCVASGCAATACSTFARRSGGSGRPMVRRPAVNSMPARAATRQTVA
jgi:hypothetical protein